jgi:N-acetylglucosamine-6-phosphate deacetylase
MSPSSPPQPPFHPREGELTARLHSTGQPARIRWANHRITTLEPAPEAAPDRWLAPGLVDLQINGYAGVDFQQDELRPEDLLRATSRLAADGCTRYLLTLVTDAWPRMLARLAQLRSLRGESSVLQQAIAGWHIEGPFLSTEPGYCGAHDPKLMQDPTREQLRELRQAAGSDALLLTLAPERPGACAAIREAVGLGMRVSLGHTNATAAELAEAVRAGAIAFTHLGNGCPRTLDRHDNILWRVLETPGLQASLIPDTIHVSPALFRLFHRHLNPAAIYYTTDAMAAAGAPPGRYRLGRLQLDVGEDQVVRLPGSPNFAGSALRPIDGIFRAAGMLGCSWREVWDRFSVGPASLMALPGGLKPGAPADFCVLELSPKETLVRLTVVTTSFGTSQG